MTIIPCERCNDTGVIGVWIRSGNYRAPGPVPEDARGTYETWCDECEIGAKGRNAERRDMRAARLRRSS